MAVSPPACMQEVFRLQGTVHAKILIAHRWAYAIAPSDEPLEPLGDIVTNGNDLTVLEYLVVHLY